MSEDLRPDGRPWVNVLRPDQVWYVGDERVMACGLDGCYVEGYNHALAVEGEKKAWSRLFGEAGEDG